MPQTGNAGEKRVLAVLALLLGVGLVPWLAEARDGGGRSQNLRGATTGPTSAPGYDHPNQYLFRTAETIAPNLEPVIRHPDVERQARQKLDEAEKRFGRKPNFLVVLLDDVAWMDFGFNGGGESVGNPTPTIDRIAHQGLVLTSAYSTPSCTPSRATIMTGQNPLHHDLLRPPMYGEPGGLDGAITFPTILQSSATSPKVSGSGTWERTKDLFPRTSVSTTTTASSQSQTCTPSGGTCTSIRRSR